MNASINNTLSKNLSLLTYNSNSIIMPKKEKLNIYMGIGLWSKKDGLTHALPIDVMQMLLTATIMRGQIVAENEGLASKVIILIANSMAIDEGADKEATFKIVQIYKQSLKPLIDLLNMNEYCEIVLSSEIEGLKEYKKQQNFVEECLAVKQLKVEDPGHYAYVRSQTVIPRYMSECLGVGIKLGWICSESSKQLNNQLSTRALERWDELKFDCLYKDICKDSKIQYLYAKAGLRQSGNFVTECPPYTAYSLDKRYILQTQERKPIDVNLLTKRVKSHWKDLPIVCADLMQLGLVNPTLLPEKCIKKNNERATLCNMLNYWTNLPVNSEA